jgi:hypothetical protein
LSVAWSPDRRAEALLPQRADLLRRLPLVAPSAVQLSEDERELVVDEALGYVVLEYEAAIGSATEAEEVFWTAARLRVARTLEGRNALVRGRFSRASEEELDRVPDSSDDPAALVERALEIDVATEFAATLAPVEGQVLRVKWLSDEKGPLGYRKVAESLGITPARARSAERAIAGKLDRFATLLSGGRLCSDRADDLATLVSAAGQDNRSVRAARAHIKHCPVCKADFVAQRRALRSAAFQRDVASVIPALPIAEAARRHGGAVRDLLADWVGRLGGTDAAPAVAQTIASGVGRGAGGVLAVKIVAVLAGGAAVIGGATQIFDGESRPATPQRPPAETATPRPSPTTRAKPEAPATQSAQRRRAQRSNARTQGGTGPRDQEQAPASDAPAGSQPAGGSEFNPDSAALPPAPPAPAPAAPGASEFP